ncbi:MAG: DoxX family protein [Cyclobacteriaceae bacterium]
MKVFEWILSLVAAFILLQTLFFKFSGAEESIFIFSTVGMEPWGRYASGVVELIAGVLLLVPKYRVYGSMLALGVISGAIFFHLTVLGIEVKGDGGQLFYYALTVFLASLFILFIRKKEIPILGSKF